MMKASIDIGTNTILLLVAEQTSDGLQIIEERQRIPRLGQGVDESQNLSKDAMDRVINALKEYQKRLTEEYSTIEAPIVVATSAVRDANNRAAFIGRVRQETGLAIQLLSGSEEAEYTFKGAQSMLSGRFGKKPLLVLDIGGGSTEMTLGKDNEILDRYSFNMGCVRFTERFLSVSEITSNHIAECRKAVQEMLNTHSFDITSDVQLVGVSGTVTSLAYMDQDLEEYQNAKIDEYRLSAETIAGYIEWTSKMTTDELLHHYPVVMEGRADIFLAGLLILEGIMDHYGSDTITVSTGGIRHGAIIVES